MDHIIGAVFYIIIILVILIVGIMSVIDLKKDYKIIIKKVKQATKVKL